MTLRLRLIFIALCWIALGLDLLHPGQFRFYLVHDGGPLQLDFSGSANGHSPSETDRY
jgi:hypothetical protein